VKEENLDKRVWGNAVEPFYFGISPKTLYGCHHKPKGMHAKACGVVLCSPIGQEYIRTHRAVYQLAVRLSQAGFHVLRFDYFGCGDSEGDFEQGSLLQWTNDIHAAIAEIQKRSGLTSVCLIGLRIGATLALEAAERYHQTKSIVLWEPIFDGKLYLEELAASQRALLRQIRYITKGVSNRFKMGIPNEILGFPMTSELRHDLEMTKMDHQRLRSNIKLLIVHNSKESNLANHPYPFAEDHPKADFRMIEDHNRIWWKEESLIPFKTVSYLVNWVEGVHS
jgi:exosortase A-associated hydrolase 2